MSKNYIMYRGTTCPTGWTENVNMRNRFLRVGNVDNQDFDDINGQNSSVIQNSGHSHVGTTAAGDITSPGTNIALQGGSVPVLTNQITGFSADILPPFTQLAADTHPTAFGTLSGNSLTEGAVIQHSHVVYLRGNAITDPWVSDASSTSPDGVSGGQLAGEQEYKNILFCYKVG